MKIDLYCTCYNESAAAPYILDYWAKFVTNAYVYDNGSTDNVLDILRAEKRFNIEIRHYDTGGTLNDGVITELRNAVWKHSCGKADFVVMCDFDEALWSRDMDAALMSMKGQNATICAPIIYELTSEVLPVHDPQKLLHESVGRGTLHMDFGKHILFDPNLISETNYSPGAHFCSPSGTVRYYDGNDIYLFHCKYIDRVLYIANHERTHARLSDTNKQNGWGVQYMESTGQAEGAFETMLNKSIKLEV